LFALTVAYSQIILELNSNFKLRDIKPRLSKALDLASLVKPSLSISCVQQSNKYIYSLNHFPFSIKLANDKEYTIFKKLYKKYNDDTFFLFDRRLNLNKISRTEFESIEHDCFYILYQKCKEVESIANQLKGQIDYHHPFSTIVITKDYARVLQIWPFGIKIQTDVVFKYNDAGDILKVLDITTNAIKKSKKALSIKTPDVVTVDEIKLIVNRQLLERLI